MTTATVPRKIAFCITELDPGGAERALVEIVKRLPRHDWTPRVITLGPPTPLVSELEAAGISVESLGAKSSRDFWVLERLRRSLRRDRPEILQTFLFHANVAGRIAGWLAGVKCVVSGLRVAEREKLWHNRLERLTAGYSRHHVAVSQGVAEFAQRVLKIPAAQLSVIGNGVDGELFRQTLPFNWTELGLPVDAQVLLAAGRLHPQKGFRRLIEAVAPLLERQANWFLVIAGEGPQRAELEGLVQQHKLAGRIVLPGWTSSLPNYLSGAQLFVLSSEWEGMPNVVLQAMASGRAVVATEVEGMVELLGTAAPELLVKPNSGDDLRQAIEDTMLRPAYRTKLGNELQVHVVKHFTWDSVAAAYGQLYTRLLS